MARLTSQIHEVIVTTVNESGQPHSAPMGVSEEAGMFVIKPFKPSSTYTNLKQNGVCSINYTDDVRIFAGALTGHRDWPTLPCDKINGHYLEAALAHTELEVIDVEDTNPRAVFYAKVLHDVTHKAFRGFNRAQSAVIEAAILASRLGMLSEDKIKQEMDYLAIAIDKTAGPKELEAWGWLMNKFEQAGVNLNHD